MSRMTAAFVCALCDPDDPRPASIMCSNNCGRYVCSVHAMPRKGPGSAMVCLACAEALGLLEKPKPRVEPTPIVSIPAEPIAKPQPQAEVTAVPKTEAPKIEPVAAAKPQADEVVMSQAAPAPKFDAGATTTGPSIIAPASPPPRQATPAPSMLDNAVPAEAQSRTARRLVDPPPPPQSSETIVSQRGNTLQVPKVTQTLPKPPQPLSVKPRLSQRAASMTVGVNWSVVLPLFGSLVLGIIGLAMLLAALSGG